MSLDGQKLRTLRAWVAEKALDYSYHSGDTWVQTVGQAKAEAYASVAQYIDDLQRVGDGPHIPFVDGD